MSLDKTITPSPRAIGAAAGGDGFTPVDSECAWDRA